MMFSEAIEAVKSGEPVAREGWNGRGMFVFKASDLAFRASSKVNKALPTPCKIEIRPALAMLGADGKITIGWLASQVDMLAEDWVIVGAPPLAG